MRDSMDCIGRKITSSLTFRCVLCVAVYACALTLVFGVARMYVQHVMSASALSMDAIVEQPDMLANDHFEVLAGMVLEPNEVVVYDDAGTCLFASTSEIAQRVPFEDLFLVASSVQEGVFYEVIERPDLVESDGCAAYEILLLEYHEDTETSEVLGRCLCDENLHILEGSLFPGVDSLSEEEFALMRGSYGRDMHIEKYEYETADGKSRTLVLASPKLNERTYRTLLKESEGIWPVAVVAALALTCAAVMVVFNTIRGSMHPLEEAIEARRINDGRQPREADLPIELRGTYHSFVELMDDLDAAHEETQTIIADVSHDLKTPLAVIGGYARAFEDGRVTDDKRPAYLHAIYEKSKAASQLLDSLLMVSRLNHPALEPDFVTCDLCEQVRLAVISAYAEVEQSEDAIEADIAEEPLWVSLDEKLFARILGNLISNACRHNEPGIHILVRCLGSGDHAIVSILDDGVGFPEELRANAFEPFVTQNVARESGKGSGLGLAIAKKGVQLHGGNIYLSEAPLAPYTTEVAIELPLRTQES